MHSLGYIKSYNDSKHKEEKQKREKVTIKIREKGKKAEPHYTLMIHNYNQNIYNYTKLNKDNTKLYKDYRTIGALR